MSTPVRASDRDLRALAAIVGEDRPDLPDGEGLPPSLLADLMGQIRCDQVVFVGFDGGRQAYWFAQEDPFKVPFTDTPGWEDFDRTYWKHYWDSQFCSYPSRTGDLRSIIKATDLCSTRQRHSTAMYTDYERPLGLEHHLMLCLPEAPPQTAEPKRHVRLYLSRGSISPSVTGRCLRCCALICTRPSWMPSGAAIPSPGSPPGNGSCCAWWPPGTPTPRSPAAWAFPSEPCAPTWRTSTNGCTCPAAPPPSPAPSPTGARRVHRPGEAGVYWSARPCRRRRLASGRRV